MDDGIEAIGEKGKKSMQEMYATLQALYASQPDAAARTAAVTGAGAVNSSDSGEALRITKSAAKSTAKFAAGAGSPEIDEPEQAVAANSRALIERSLAHLQLDNSLQANKLVQERQEINGISAEKKHVIQIRNVDKQIGDSPGDKSTLDRVFRWIGVAVALAMAVGASIASGGAATGLIIAAVTALVMAIGEESGAFKAAEEEISKSLQKDQGMSRKDADAAAQQIMTAITTVLEVAGEVAGGAVKTAAEKTAGTIVKKGLDVAAREAVKEGSKEAAKKLCEEAGKKIGEEAAKQLYTKAEKVIDKAVKEVEKTAEKAIKLGTEKASKTVEEAVKKATDGLSKKIGGQLDDLFKAAGGETKDIKAMMNGVQDQVMKPLQDANKIATAMKVQNAVNKTVSNVQTGISASDQVEGVKEEERVKEVEAEQVIDEADARRVLELMSQDVESMEQIQKRVNTLNDGMVEMLQSRDNSLRDISNLIVG